MSNQTILWAMIILPWFTLLFMPKKDIKRFMPVGIFTALTSVLIGDIGVTLGIWVHQQTAYPLHSVMPFNIGLSLALTMWVFKYTYGRFWKYFTVNLLLDIGFNFIFFGYLLPSRNIMHVGNASPSQLLAITLAHAVFIYGYQMWQEGIFVKSERTSLNSNLQLAVAKPLSEDQKDNMLEQSRKLK